MATTTNYGWTTPDDTDLVKDGAAAIRTLGSSADTTVKNLNPGTTAGDVDYYTSGTAKARLAIGTAGQVLTVNSGATAPEWATPGGAGENWSLVNAGGTSLTGAATVTVSGISGKNRIMVIVDGASSASASSFMGIRVNTDSTNVYYAFGQENALNSTYSAGMFASRGEAGNSINLGRMGDSAANTLDGAVVLSGCNSAGVKQFISAGAGNGTSARQYLLQGYVDLSATISSISVISGTGNFDDGAVYVYATA